MQTGEEGSGARAELRRRTWLVLGQVLVAAAALFLLWKALLVVLLVFAGVLLAVFLSGLARAVSDRLPVPYRLSVVAVTLALVAVGAGVTSALGPTMVEEFGRLTEQLPTSYDELRAMLERTDWGERVLSLLPSPEAVEEDGMDALGRVGSLFTLTFGAVVNLLVVGFLGIYFALAPASYRDAVIRLLPPVHREGPERTLLLVGSALRSWLTGRIASMAAVAVLTAVGLFVLGVPLALTLALIAGLLNFVPYLGPVVAAVPAVLVAWGESGSLALWVAVYYIGVQTVESFVITPYIQKLAVSIPPALLVTSQILMGLAAGVLGVLLATPTAVTVVVLIQTLYVDDTLGEEVEVLGN